MPASRWKATAARHGKFAYRSSAWLSSIRSAARSRRSIEQARRKPDRHRNPKTRTTSSHIARRVWGRFERARKRRAPFGLLARAALRENWWQHSVCKVRLIERVERETLLDHSETTCRWHDEKNPTFVCAVVFSI